MVMTGNQMAGLVFVVLAIVVLIIVLRERLSLSGRKKETGYLSDSSDYLKILKKGWSVTSKNLWVFWILWIFSFLAFFQITVLNLSRKNFQFLSFNSYLHGIHFSFFQKFIHSFFLAPVYIPFSFGIENSLFFLLALIIILKPFKSLISQSSQDVQLASSTKFLEKNLPFFLIASIIAVFCNILLSIRAPLFFHNSIGQISLLAPARIYSAIMVYWSAFIQALLTGFILSVFKAIIDGDEVKRHSIFVASLKFFRPLFFFYLILIGIFYCWNTIANLLYLRFVRQSSYNITSILLWLVLAFFLIPYLLVHEESDLKTAFARNFFLWKQNWRQILCFLLLIILLISVINTLLAFGQIFIGTWFQLAMQVVEKTIRLVLRLWIAASIMVFYRTLRETKIIKKLSEK